MNFIYRGGSFPIKKVLLILVCSFVLSACRTGSITRQRASSSTFDVRRLDPEFHLSFDWPAQFFKVGDLFGWRSKKRFHDGVDLRMPRGTPVTASESGRVIYVGRKIRGYGIIVILDHGNGWTSFYAHLSKPLVHSGDQVLKGDHIALSGNTGRSTGAHLHFEIRKGSDPLDPMLFLPTSRLPKRAKKIF